MIKLERNDDEPSDHSRNPANPHTPDRRRNRRTTAIGVTAGLLGGGAIGLLVAMPSFSSAASDTTTTPPTTAVVIADDSGTKTPRRRTCPTPPTAPTPSDADREDEHRPARIRTELQNLVDDGTITATQADAVAADLASSLPDRGPGRPGGPGWGHRHPGFDGEVLAGLLGIDVETLRSDLRDGKTVAEIAGEQGVDVQTVIDSLVADAKSHLDLSVQNGRLTQEEATPSSPR